MINTIFIIAPLKGKTFTFPCSPLLVSFKEVCDVVGYILEKTTRHLTPLK